MKQNKLALKQPSISKFFVKKKTKIQAPSNTSTSKQESTREIPNSLGFAQTPESRVEFKPKDSNDAGPSTDDSSERPAKKQRIDINNAGDKETKSSRKAAGQVRRMLVSDDNDSESSCEEWSPDNQRLFKKTAPAHPQKGKSPSENDNLSSLRYSSSDRKQRDSAEPTPSLAVASNRPQPISARNQASSAPAPAPASTPSRFSEAVKYTQAARQSETMDPFDRAPLNFSRPKVSAKSFGSLLKSKEKYTPLEQQVVDIKSRYPDVILAVEVGYKYRFFGHDAEVAAKELNIMCFLSQHFMTASIPTQRLFVHVRHLVEIGYKVGVVAQIETAALKKAGDNKSAPFTRELKHLYTKSTMIGEEIHGGKAADACAESGTSNFLVCLQETIIDEAKHVVTMSMAAISIETGEVIYDAFKDEAERAELATRLSHIRPVEVLLSASTGSRTRKFLKNFSTSKDSPPRIEMISQDNFDLESNEDAGSKIKAALTAAGSSEATKNTLVTTLVELPLGVQICLDVISTYLEEFGLSKVFELVGNAKQFSTRGQNMLLNGATMRNLELFENSTNHTSTGSLYAVINHTSTQFGARLLRKWLANPLIDTDKINLRLKAVEQLSGEAGPALQPLFTVMRKLPDLEKGILGIFLRKCSTADFLGVLESLEQVQKCLSMNQEIINQACFDGLVRDAVDFLLESLHNVPGMLAEINPKAASNNDKVNLFTSDESRPEMARLKACIRELQNELTKHLKDLRRQFGMPTLTYSKVSQEEYLIELPKSAGKKVPNDWETIQKTTKVSRFRSPFIIKKMEELGQHRELLDSQAAIEWSKFLSKFTNCFDSFRTAIRELAFLDCVRSLAIVSMQPGYVKPTVLPNEYSTSIKITNGCNPVVASLTNDNTFVPNDVYLSNDPSGIRCYIITGPNMGGKSCFIRQVAMLSIMAQIGSFVPAETMAFVPLDAVFTRMGAEDNIFAHESTFMHELNEASQILQLATDKSLVIMDELGRGTSTHDGVAIAEATCSHLVNVNRCLTLFVTHYPPLAEMAYPVGKTCVGNYHMAFMEDSDGDETMVTFLYKLVSGAAGKSYGLNVARLAGISKELLDCAGQKSKMMEQTVRRSTSTAMFRRILSSLCDGDTKTADILKLYDSMQRSLR